MASMTQVTCKCCHTHFEARTADVQRGWGKFCSKSCKAIDQTKRKNRSIRRKARKARKQKTSGRYIMPHHEYIGTLFDSDGNQQ